MARCAIQHNGLLHVAGPQAAAKALLAAPPHATAVMSCAPSPCACGMALATCSAKPHASSHWPACPCLRHRHRSSSQALRAVRGVGPRPPCGARRFAPLARAGRWPVRPPRGLPPPPALGCGGVGKRGACAGRRSRLAGASPGKQPQQPARRCAPCPSRGAPTPSLFVGEGAPAVPGSKGRCAPLARWPAASLDSLAPLTPVSLMRGGVPLHARRAGCHYRPPLFIHH